MAERCASITGVAAEAFIDRVERQGHSVGLPP